MDLKWYFLGFLFLIYVLVPVFLYLVTPSAPDESTLYKRRRAVVLVLGDLNRSPRMNYHALSLAQTGYDVDLCGYQAKGDGDGQNAIHELIKIRPIEEVRNTWRLPFLLFAIQKVLLQHYYLYKVLKPLKNADIMIVQNPPSIPVLGVIRFYILFVSQHTKLIIDWHNLGYSILALKLGNKHPFVIAYRWYEKIFGRRAFAHFTVSVTMAQQLRKQFGMDSRRIIPLYDRPGEQFQVIDKDNVPEVKRELAEKYDEFVVKDDEKVIITSTSYTPDEDLGVLLDALVKYEQDGTAKKPNLRVFITGKGPMYNEVADKIKQLNLTKSSIHQIWLSMEDYPKILGIADLGISLHTSSSGWDLPMKVVDMFGCGVPVIALDFEALHELVNNLENGVVVKDSETMAQALIDVLTNPQHMLKIRTGALKESQLRWPQNWSTKVGPLFVVKNRYHPDYQDITSESSSSDSE